MTGKEVRAVLEVQSPTSPKGSSEVCIVRVLLGRGLGYNPQNIPSISCPFFLGFFGMLKNFLCVSGSVLVVVPVVVPVVQSLRQTHYNPDQAPKRGPLAQSPQGTQIINSDRARRSHVNVATESLATSVWEAKSTQKNPMMRSLLWLP